MREYARLPHPPSYGTMRAVMEGRSFWQALDRLVAGREVVVDRPRGTSHPRYPEFAYPLDYGYLAGTRSGDGEGAYPASGPTPMLHRTVGGVRAKKILCPVKIGPIRQP